jgi:repressor LexA
MPPEPLTPRQKQVLDYLQHRESLGKSPPSVREVAAHFGFASPRAAALHIDALVQKGALLRDPRKARSLRLTSDVPQPNGPPRSLPLLGRIPAGPLSEALESPEYLSPAELLPHRSGDFLLKVCGDSMTGDGILDGDLVLLRPGIPVPHGAIAAVCVGDEREATLKRVFPEGPLIRLRAAHPAYRDIVVPADSVTVAGVFRGLVRQA